MYGYLVGFFFFFFSTYFLYREYDPPGIKCPYATSSMTTTTHQQQQQTIMIYYYYYYEASKVETGYRDYLVVTRRTNRTTSRRCSAHKRIRTPHRRLATAGSENPRPAGERRRQRPGERTNMTLNVCVYVARAATQCRRRNGIRKMIIII